MKKIRSIGANTAKRNTAEEDRFVFVSETSCNKSSENHSDTVD